MTVSELCAGLLSSGLISWALIGAVLIGSGTALAQDDAIWTVTNKIHGKPKGPVILDSTDVSGVACATASGFPRICMVVDDETQGAQIVVAYDGNLIAGQFIPLIDAQHEGKPVELDAEAVAYANGAFYVIGSHGRARHESDPRKEAKNEQKAVSSRQVFQIRFDLTSVDPATGMIAGALEIRRSTKLIGLIQAHADLAPFFDKPLDDNGLTIEGVVVRGDTLYAGMRGPVLENGSAVILSAPLATIFETDLAAPTLHRVSLGQDSSGRPRGIRDIADFEDIHLILAGPVNDPPKGQTINAGDYAVYSWDRTQVQKLLDLPGFGEKVKPEALLPLDKKDGTLRALLFFDGPANGAPRPIVIEMP